MCECNCSTWATRERDRERERENEATRHDSPRKACPTARDSTRKRERANEDQIYSRKWRVGLLLPVYDSVSGISDARVLFIKRLAVRIVFLLHRKAEAQITHSLGFSALAHLLTFLLRAAFGSLKAGAPAESPPGIDLSLSLIRDARPGWSRAGSPATGVNRITKRAAA